MFGLTAGQAELLSGAVGFFFTIALLSYVIGDNPLYRVALHLFIGVSVGYVALIVWYQIVIQRVLLPLLSGNLTVMLIAVVPLILFAFLIFKLSATLSPLGNISVAYLVGVGIAVAVGGALTGTLFPQVMASWQPILPGGDVSPAGAASSLIFVLAVVLTLIYFQFWLRERTATGDPVRLRAFEILASAGQGVVVVTLGVVYGGLIISGLAVLSERLIAVAQWAVTALP
ncbi:MAG: hypothetical protein GYB64_06555 [Chloroflexi bacterium]|nr:hypothetical protein [Chloroflexota bacterium]